MGVIYLANMVSELKKVNRELTLKVRELEDTFKWHNDRIKKLVNENSKLKSELANYNLQKKNDEMQLMNYFGSIFGRITDIMILQHEKIKDYEGDTNNG